MSILQRIILFALLGLLLIVNLNIVHGENAGEPEESRTTSTDTTDTANATDEDTSNRMARVMKIRKDIENVAAAAALANMKRARGNRMHPNKPQLRSSVEHFPNAGLSDGGISSLMLKHLLPIQYPHPRTHLGGMPKSMHGRPQILRRVQNGIQSSLPQRIQQTQQRGSFDPAKSSRYSSIKSGPQYGGGGGQGAGVYHSQYSAGGAGNGGTSGQHPNSLGAQIATKQQQQHAQNFKASPVFNGKAIIRPVSEQNQLFKAVKQQQLQIKLPSAQTQQTLQYSLLPQEIRPKYPPQQYPMPEQAPQHQNGLQAQKPNYQQQQAHAKYDKGKGNIKTYSVYEDQESGEHATLLHDSQNNQLTYNPNYPIDKGEPTAQEAQEYLKFMSSNEYFLPKRDPNYKQIDADKDRMFYQQQQQQKQQQQVYQQQHQQYQYQERQKQKQQQQIEYSKGFSDTSVASTSGSGSGYTVKNIINSAPAYRKPIQASQLFFQQDPLPNSAIVRGSYQTGNNVFVVNSDGNKAVKHVVASPLPTQATTTKPAYTKNQQKPVRSRTPEPLRFEFTERDAVLSTYTNAPANQLRYKTVVIASTPRTPISSSTSSTVAINNINNKNNKNNNYNAIKPISEVDDDPEDGEDVQESNLRNIYGKGPLRKDKPTSSSDVPTEQKDTEEYCETICANVQDDDEEIVCGSDGYMYTSEAQMQCYSSCLHIDVTIQSKGSCSAT